jgi:hypothetical protein
VKNALIGRAEHPGWDRVAGVSVRAGYTLTGSAVAHMILIRTGRLREWLDCLI